MSLQSGDAGLARPRETTFGDMEPNKREAMFIKLLGDGTAGSSQGQIVSSGK